MPQNDLTEQILEEAASPVSSGTDGQSATGRPIGDMIQADQYASGKPAVRKRRRGIQFTKFINPGALSDGGQANPGCGFNTCGGC